MSRYQKYHVKWPWTPRQVENLDEMLGIFTKDIGALTDATISTTTSSTSGVTTAISQAFIGVLQGRDGEDGQDGLQGAVGPQGLSGPAGRPGLDGADGEESSWPPAGLSQRSTLGVVASIFKKAETGTDANVLTYVTGPADEYLNVQIAADVSALTGTSIVITLTWKDSNNATATSTLTLSGIGDGTLNIPINAFTATSVVVSTVFIGVSTSYKISAAILRLL